MTLRASMSSHFVFRVPPLPTLAPAPDFWKTLKPRTLAHHTPCNWAGSGREVCNSSCPNVPHSPIRHTFTEHLPAARLWGGETNKSDWSLPWGASSLARLPAHTRVWASTSVCQGQTGHMPVLEQPYGSGGVCPCLCPVHT